MKLISWNVNGFRSVMNKGFMEFLNDSEADIFCIQETKMRPEQLQVDLPNYKQYWNSAIKKGYSGTAIFTKLEPINVRYGLGLEEFDNEGRVITLEFENFYLVNVYTPNTKQELLRLNYRMNWEDYMKVYLLELNNNKPVILCGDLNVAHREIDLKNPSSNRRSPGFTDEEREKMTKLLDSGFIDTFRYLYPDKRDIYTWWSYMRKARENNSGWRIDYFIISDNIKTNLKEALIYNNVYGSDHCPVGILIEI